MQITICCLCNDDSIEQVAARQQHGALERKLDTLLGGVVWRDAAAAVIGHVHSFRLARDVLCGVAEQCDAMQQ